MLASAEIRRGGETLYHKGYRARWQTEKIHGDVAELAYAYGLGPYSARIVGSTPTVPTIYHSPSKAGRVHGAEAKQ